MGQTKEALSRARLRPQGEWYPAGEVDRLLEELAACAGEDDRQAARLRSQVERLQALAGHGAGFSEEEAQRQVCRDLEAQRDGLIQDIKALRRFREEYRQAVEEEARQLLRQFGVPDPGQGPRP